MHFHTLKVGICRVESMTVSYKGAKLRPNYHVKGAKAVPRMRMYDVKGTNGASAQEWTSRTLVGHEPRMCSKICCTKTE